MDRIGSRTGQKTGPGAPLLEETNIVQRDYITSEVGNSFVFVAHHLTQTEADRPGKGRGLNIQLPGGSPYTLCWTTHIERHVEVGSEREEKGVEGPSGGVELGLLLLREHLRRRTHLGPRLLVENTRGKQVLDRPLKDKNNRSDSADL